jgi:hypothetical protein
MTSQPSSVAPPRLAAWLVDLFTVPGEEEIQGDMVEEFAQFASDSGIGVARVWYWRQALKAIPHLLVASYRAAPWSTTAAVIGGHYLRRLSGVVGLPESPIFAVLRKYQVFENHFDVYRFFASTGIDIGHLFVFLFVGAIVALAARRRAMAATVTLSLYFLAKAVVGSLFVVATRGDYAYLWRLAWYFSDAFAVVIGGAVVVSIMRRSSAAPLPAAT